MSFPIYTRAVICYVEAHIRDGRIDYGELERSIGYSMAHIRDVFHRDTGIPFVRYVRTRKISSSAFELLHSHSSILDIALMYGFENHETYTRAFKKLVGVTPSQFRKERRLAGKEELALGIYGIGLLSEKEKRSDIMMNAERYKDNESTVLYGVPRVGFGVYHSCTPFPICMKAVSDYLGEDVDYAYSMVSSGAAFRLTWNRAKWDLSNVDIYHTMEESNEIYRLGIDALGREFEFLGRDAGTTKEDFICFIKKHIDEGYPCIALGIIGPPEACIITGYRDGGKVLLGWNFFQNDPSFGNCAEVDESGYFISSQWWENTDTQAVMCMGPVVGEPLPVQRILEHAIQILSGRQEGNYSKGIDAYDAWKDMLSDEKHFHVGDTYSVLFEKLLCQNDATGSLHDGRGKASDYFRKLAEEAPSHAGIYQEIADAFLKTSEYAEQMGNLLGSWEEEETRLKNFADADVRRQICELIEKAKKSDAEALEKMKIVLA